MLRAGEAPYEKNFERSGDFGGDKFQCIFPAGPDSEEGYSSDSSRTGYDPAGSHIADACLSRSGSTCPPCSLKAPAGSSLAVTGFPS